MSKEPILKTFSAFLGERCVATGSIKHVALEAKKLADAAPDSQVLFFDDDSGEVLDVSLRGSPVELERRLVERFGVVDSDAIDQQPEPPESVTRRRGRPKLGVVTREVALLPRHWEWLISQPGSVSVALRLLIDEARRVHGQRDRRRQAQKATYLFMSAMAGDRIYFEDATRALFAGDKRRFHELIEPWPVDIRRNAERLSVDAF